MRFTALNQSQAFSARARNKGYALITAVIFLMVLTTVSFYALKNTGLELKMSANNSMSAEAFGAAEVTRTLVSQLIEPHVYSRGWPETAGGSIADDAFGYDIPMGLTLAKNSKAAAPDDWYSGSFITSSSFNPTDLSTASANYSRDVASADSGNYKLQATVAVRKLRADISPGSGAAMSAGYDGLGKSVAAGGGNLFFYVVARGQDPNSQAVAFTASTYRYVIRN